MVGCVLIVVDRVFMINIVMIVIIVILISTSIRIETPSLHSKFVDR